MKKLYAVPQVHWNDAGYQTEINVFLVNAENAEEALALIKEDREVNQYGHYEYDDIVEVTGEGVQNIYHSDDN